MKKQLVLFCMLFIGINAFSQIDCETTLAYRKAIPPYEKSELSKSIQCSTNNKYEQNVSLKPGYEYRISFYASTIFNNRMNFEIIDTKTGKTLLNVPGETKENKKGECALKEYWDYKYSKTVYPYFEFSPQEIQNLKIIIDIPEYKEKIKIREKDEDLGVEEEWVEYVEKRKGCVTTFVLMTKAD
jgi:hypothetical protein